MKRKLIELVLVTSLFLSFTATPASAILGLSKCEKMVKVVKQKDLLIRELWKNYDRERRSLQSGIEASSKLAGMVNDVNRAYLDGLRAMKANSNCFKVTDRAKIINSITNTEQNIASWKTYLRNPTIGVVWSTRLPTIPGSLLAGISLK